MNVQNNEVEALPASSRMASSIYVRTGESGARDSSGTVAEKCGEERWKLTLRNSLLSLRVREAMVQAISFCRSGRVLMING